MTVHDGAAADKSAPVYGPEPWRTVACAEWSYWDLWFCTVCVVYHDGDWDALDAAIQGAEGSDGEAKWSHLLSLTERLRHAGLRAGDLAATAADRKVRAKARAKVMKATLYERDRTPAMCDPPSARLRRRALFGSWPEFPRSPQPPYDSVSARFDLDRRPTWDGWATSDMAYEVDRVEREMIAHAGDDAATSLAIRRAFLTWYYEATEACDDSYGGLGDVAGEAVVAYAGTDRRAAGIGAEVFWRDLLQWCVFAANYGLLHAAKVTVLRRGRVGRDLDLAEAILVDLAEVYANARMRYHAEEALCLRACAMVAAGKLTRFEPAAAAIGSDNWGALDVMVDAALRRRRTDIAIAVLDAADVPGRHRERARARRAELAASSRDVPQA